MRDQIELASETTRVPGCLADQPNNIRADRARSLVVRRSNGNAATCWALVVCVLLGRVGARTNFCGELFGGAPEQSGHVGELFDELGLVLAGA